MTTTRDTRERAAAEQVIAQLSNLRYELAAGERSRFDQILDAVLASAWGEAMVLHRAEEILADQREVQMNRARALLGQQQSNPHIRLRTEAPFHEVGLHILRAAAARANDAIEEWHQQIDAYINGERDTVPDYPDFAE